MASTRQSKHHARFHAAVLRYLFPALSTDSSNANSHQEEVDQNHEEAYFQARLPESAELVAEEKHSNGEDVGVEVGTLSRAQRKRLKLKKVKETVSDAVPDKKLIGPLLPDVLEKGRHGLDDLKSVVGLLQEDDTAQKCLTPTNTGDGQDVHDVGEHESLSIGTEDEKCMHNAGELESLCTNTEEGDVYDGAVGTENEKHMHNAGELKSSCTNTGQGKDVHEGEECQFLSRTKRRRLAKKNFQNNFPRRPVAGSSFTAEKRGEDIIIKQIL